MLENVGTCWKMLEHEFLGKFWKMFENKVK